MTSAFAQKFLDVQLTDNKNYHWNTPDQWQQGRGAFGGLVTASKVLALEHAQQTIAPSQKLRSMTSMLCGPTLPGDTSIDLLPVRQGSNTTTWSARLSQTDDVKAESTALFGAERVEDATWNDMTPPEMTPWQDLGVIPLAPPFAPVFSAHMDYRTDDALPIMNPKEERATHGWVNLKEPPAQADNAYIALLMDAWWPCILSTLKQPRPIATISTTIQFLEDPSILDTSKPLKYRATMSVSMHGYAVEFRELWTEDNVLMALNQQTIAIIK